MYQEPRNPKYPYVYPEGVTVEEAAAEWAKKPGRKFDGTETFNFNGALYDVIKQSDGTLSLYPLCFGQPVLWAGRRLEVAL